MLSSYAYGTESPISNKCRWWMKIARLFLPPKRRCHEGLHSTSHLLHSMLVRRWRFCREAVGLSYFSCKLIRSASMLRFV